MAAFDICPLHRGRKNINTFDDGTIFRRFSFRAVSVPELQQDGNMTRSSQAGNADQKVFSGDKSFVWFVMIDLNAEELPLPQ
jgi:hypothetical protein